VRERFSQLVECLTPGLGTPLGGPLCGLNAVVPSSG